MSDAAVNPMKAGLEDVVVSPSEICFIDGHKGRLVYRGFDVDPPAVVIDPKTGAAVGIALEQDGGLPAAVDLKMLREELTKTAAR